MNCNNQLLQKINIKELNNMDITSECCELFEKAFERDLSLAVKESSSQNKAKRICDSCITSSDWLKNIEHLVIACKICLENLSSCISSGLENDVSRKRFLIQSDIYVELFSSLTGIIAENTNENTTLPNDFPEELSCAPFSNDITTQFAYTLKFLTYIQIYAKSKNINALSYCLQILFVTDLENIRIFDELEKKHQTVL